jgi:hypothetical protein
MEEHHLQPGVITIGIGSWRGIEWFGRDGSSNKTIGATHFVLEAMA